jgi:Outer membrane protein beta-barrel domain
MKALKPLAVVSVLSASAFAQQDNGLFVSAGGGYAKLSADDFVMVTGYGETLRTTDTGDTVGFLRGELGYRFNPTWDVALAYTDYGTGEVHMSFPKYPGIASILPFPDYSKNVMTYEATRIALIPSYTHALGEKLSLRARAGVTYDDTKAHFETTYYAVFSGRPSETFSESFPEAKDSRWSYLLSIGADYAITPRLSIGITVTYAPFTMKTANEQIFGVGNGTARPSDETLDVESVEGAIVFTWRQ